MLENLKGIIRIYARGINLLQTSPCLEDGMVAFTQAENLKWTQIGETLHLIGDQGDEEKPIIAKMDIGKNIELIVTRN